MMSASRDIEGSQVTCRSDPPRAQKDTQQHPSIMLSSKAGEATGGARGEKRQAKEEEMKEEKEEVAPAFDVGAGRDPVYGTTAVQADNELLPATATASAPAAESSLTATLHQAEGALKELYEIHDSFFSADKDEKQVGRAVPQAQCHQCGFVLQCDSPNAPMHLETSYSA